MSQEALHFLLQADRDNASGLLCLDENHLDSHLSPSPSCTLYSNRFDIAQKFTANFCDWQFNEKELDYFSFSVSKERSVNHYLLSQAYERLRLKGELRFFGQKNQGIKSYAKQAEKLFGNCSIEKHGLFYFCRSIKNQPQGLNHIDHKHYPDLREIANLHDQALYSKPGQFGWNKIDKGSEFLIQNVLPRVENKNIQSLLDIGCGYGYLSCATLDYIAHNESILDIQRLCATDNNAAAIESCRKNLANFARESLQWEVVAADCAQGIEQSFDLILCNPPFHQGFDVESQLSDRFLNAAKQRLNKEGRAYFVVNSFIGLEKKAAQHFKEVNSLANNKQFKIIELSQS